MWLVNMKKLLLTLLFTLFLTTNIYAFELKDTLNIFALPLAMITHELGHSAVVLAQGGEVTDFQVNRMSWEGDINEYSVNIGGVLATRLGYYLTRNSKNDFIHTYSEICRLDLHYQVIKGIFSEGDLADDRWIPFLLLSGIDIYEDDDIKITPLGISIKW